jgi:hypothetical protein
MIYVFETGSAHVQRAMNVVQSFFPIQRNAVALKGNLLDLKLYEIRKMFFYRILGNTY